MAWDKTYCHLLGVCRQAVKSIYARLSIFGNKSIITCHSEAWAHISAPHKTNSSSQALMCQNITSEAFTELRLSNSRRQTQGRHPPQGTHAPLRTLRAWETWAQTEDCMVLLTTPLLWATRQVGFEGKTNAATGLLSTLPKGNCLLSSLMSLPSPCRAANTVHTMASWRSKQERPLDSFLLREKRSLLTPSHLTLKAQGMTVLLFFL